MAKASDEGVSIHAGFPNPATDPTIQSLDLNRLLIKHPASTFLMRLDGNEWQDEGIFSGDLLVIDRAKDPTSKDLLIWVDEEGFYVGRVKDLPKDCEQWGVVVAVVRKTSK